jgi:hypothetical protein
MRLRRNGGSVLAGEPRRYVALVGPTVKVDPVAKWNSITSSWDDCVARIDIEQELTRVGAKCESEAKEHLSDWLALIDESLQAVLQLHALMHAKQRESLDSHPITVLMCTARGAACLIGIRHLLSKGLEDVARPVARSLFETLDLALACLAEREFAEKYLGSEERYDANEFWSAEIGYGKMSKRLRKCLASLEVPNDQIEAYLDEQYTLKQEMSGATHGGMRSGFRSLGVPSLIHEGMYSTEFLGHHSRLTPFLAYWVGDRIHAFCEIIVTLLLTLPRTQTVEFVDADRKVARPFFAAFFVLQHLLDELKPDLDARYEKMRQQNNKTTDTAEAT